MDLDLPIWDRSIPYLLVYFAPVYIGAVRRFRNRQASWPVWALFLIVYFTGMTVIGWIVALRMAFKDKSLDWLTKSFTQVSSGGGGGAGGGTSNPAPDSWLAPPEKTKCMSCDNGTHYCSVCSGQGRWWDPAGNGFCQTCLGNGKINCTNCRGTGFVG